MAESAPMLAAMDLAILAVTVVIAILGARALAWRLVRLLFWVTAQGQVMAANPALRQRARPLRDKLRARFPHLFMVAAARLDPARFAGLPLTLLVIAAIYVAGLLGGLIGEVLEAEGAQRLDQAIQGFFGPWRVQPLIATFLWVTALGAGPTLTAVSLVATGFLWAHGRAYFIVPLWITFLGAQGTTWLGKYALARQRPDFIESVSAFSPSFPSGHTTASMALYGFLAYLLARDLQNFRARFEIAFWALVLIATIGFSRVFLSVHYATDVAAGAMVGLFWLLVGFVLTELARVRFVARPHDVPRA